jgi:hypothetical protein
MGVGRGGGSAGGQIGAGSSAGGLMGVGRGGGSAGGLTGAGRGGGSAEGLMSVGCGGAGDDNPGTQPNPETIIININLIYYYNYYIFIDN